MMYFCCDEPRRKAVKDNAGFNGIHYMEVLDDPNQPVEQRQRTLSVYFLKPLSSLQLAADNVLIEGGERITGIKVVSAVGAEDLLTVEVDKAGDFSIYTLRLVKGASNAEPPDGIDPFFAAIDFSFKVECPSDFDCEPQRVCPLDPRVEPDIDYLAKDYASFRRLMLDRMAATFPQWRERHAADQGNMLVELLAYVGDHLSYRQDAVATEAYLGTARRRVSVRRHARLVDYFMHDGCNARAWVQVQAAGTNVVLNRLITVDEQQTTTKLLTRVPGFPNGVIQPGSSDHRKIMESRPLVFEPMEDAVLFAAHNEMTLYTWGERECCLPKGATKAYLQDDAQDRLHLRPGDLLIFEEVLGPRTGEKSDADPTRRHAVRLTQVHPEASLESDGVSRQPGPLVTDTLTGQAYVEIQWDPMDALPFPICASRVTDEDAQYKDNVSVVRGNILLADHGSSIAPEPIGKVPVPEIDLPRSTGDPCRRPSPKRVFPRFRPTLSSRPLTQEAPYAPEAAKTEPAARAMHWSMRDAAPQLTLVSDPSLDARGWTSRRDLINSNQTDSHFVVEIERDGTAYLRFGDDRYGSRPEPGTEFTAEYRVGNGTAGNIPTDSLAYIVTNQTGIEAIRNLLPAWGGVEPERMEDVRQRAPVAFRRQERAVTPDDYAEVAERQGEVQKAAATFRWTGSWHTVYITADRDQGLGVDSTFEARTRAQVERFRMAGHDLEVDSPRFVPLKLAMSVCVKPDYFRGDVKEALLEVFGSGSLPDGRRGLFHPDNWTFGQTVFLSPLYAAAQSVSGVDSVHITKLERLHAPDPQPLETGKLDLGRLEIARLRNDPNFPEHGVLLLELGGGK